MRRLSLTAVFSFATLFSACEPQKVEPVLQLTPSPRTIDGIGQKSNIRIFAVDDTGKPGTGSVKVTSSQGSLKDGESVTLSEGAGVIEFECNRATEPTCLGKVDLDAEWSVGGKIATATSSLTVSPPPLPDGGITVTTSRAAVGIGLSQRADLTATYYVDGAPKANESISFTAINGVIQAMDGTPFSTGTTDFAGQVHAYFADNGTAGTATITANGPMGKSGTATINVYLPDAGIDIVSDRTVLTVGFGEFARLNIAHTLDGRGIAGRPITVETTAGVLQLIDGGTFVSPALTDASGRVEARLTDMGAAGNAAVTATDTVSGKSDSTTVQLATPDVGVTVSVSRPRIYVGVTDSSIVTARLITNGSPAANRPLEMTTTQGQLVQTDGGVFTSPATTDANGNVTLRLNETGVEGTAVITGKDPDSMRTGTANVEIVRVGSVSYVPGSMTCGGTPCSIMGIAGSGFNTSASFRFVVRDATGSSAPVPGVRVSFSLSATSPTGTTVTQSAVSDASGNVDAIVNAGAINGSFILTATVIPGISGVTPTVGVRGAKPSSKGFQLSCADVNLPVYVSNTPPALLQTNCTVSLSDRLNNPIGTGRAVEFLAEAGTIASSVGTTPYSPTGSNEGVGTVAFETRGTFPAALTDPLPAAAGQYPIARVAEPFSADRNPRDALVNIIAFTDGEEWFDDANSNGTWDTGEQFIDQGEPFVDTNDNNVYDTNEPYRDADMNGSYTAPNGTWDAISKVWTSTNVLYTDIVSGFVASPMSFVAPKGATLNVNISGLDRNLNVVDVSTTTSAYVARTGTAGGFAWVPDARTDGYGFAIRQRELTNLAGTGPCQASTPICVFRTTFGGWTTGYLGFLTVVGAPLGDLGGPYSVSATVRVTTSTVSAETTVFGTMQ